MRSHHLLITAAFGSLALLAACPLAAQELRILSKDAGGLTVSYEPVVHRTELRIGDRVHTDVTFAGASYDAAALPGEPALRMRIAELVLPALTGNTVTILQADYADARNVLLAPMPLEREYDGPFPLGAGYLRGGFMPERVASLDHVGIARDMILGTLRLSPVQYDGAARTLRTYSRIIVRIDYGTRHPRLAVRPRGTTTDIRVLNSDDAAAWRVPPAEAVPAVLRKTADASLSTGDWFRIDITEEGMYHLTKAWFTANGISVDGVDPRTIRMYGTGGRELPTAVSAVRGPLMDVAITVTGADDGRFDEGDEVIFYGRSVSGFKYNPATRRYNHTHHRFANINSYLMTFGGAQGRRIVRQPSLNDPNPHRMGWFAGKEFVEEEETNILNSGLLWLSRRITPGFSNAGITYTRKLEGLVPTEPILYRMELWSQAQTGTSNQFTVRENGQTLAIIPMPTVNLNTDRDYIAGSSGQIEKTGPGTIPDGRSVLSFIYTASDPAQNRGGYINWVEWYYARRFEAAGDYLAFSGPDTNATVAYELNGFSMSDVRVYDVTAHDSVREITGCDISGGTVRFQARSEAGNPPQYIALVSRVLKTPALVARIENTDILDLTGAENIIVTAPEFLEEARRLKQHRERAEDPISTTIVTVPNIYNAFNSGVADPTAIRNFIAYAYARWSVTPRYLLLLGDGNYDYLQHDPGTREPQYVPVWESENSVHLINNYVTDDYYAQVAGNDTRVDLAVGRLPVQSADEARGVIDKIIRYDAQPDLDPWRNRLTFVADDGVTTQGDIEYNQHTAQSEQMATSLPPEVEEKKIYIVSYRTEFTAQGRRKPEAAQAIIDQINAGTILVNWTGHGSESVWAHEQVFSNEGTIPQLKNNDRLSFFVAATCTFGLYDRPGVRSGLEELMIRPDRGAIGGLASPRVVFSNDNANYNLSFLANVITNGRESDGRVRRIGDGNFATKQQWTGDAAFEKFYLMGDPAMRLGLPRYRAAIDSILVNGRLVTGDTAQMKALSKVTIAVSVVRPDGSVWQEFNGVSDVTLFDAERRVPVPDWNNWEYTAPGGVLYTGQATVREGRFSVGFIVPKDISYENRNGRLSAYFDNAHVDGVGFSKSFRVGGTDTTADADTKGPDIQLFLDNRSFKAGDMTNENAAFIADLFDESGINTTGLGVGHSIEAWLDGHEPSVVLNEYYRGETDSHQKGTVTYPLRALASGTHTIRLRAWDVYNNSSSAETHFVVANSTQLAIRDVYAYPNPMREQTAFTFQHNQSGPVSVEVKIYTVAGHLVTTLSERNVTDRFVQLNWDGRDAEGDRPANGVYFFKVVCRSADGNFGSEALGKLSILR